MSVLIVEERGDLSDKNAVIEEFMATKTPMKKMFVHCWGWNQICDGWCVTPTHLGEH